MTTAIAKTLSPERMPKSGRWPNWDRVRLAQDHASKAYKTTHGTFARYCREVHGVGVRTAYTFLSGKRCNKQPIPEGLRWEIWERDNFTCAYCGARQFLSIDHVVPACEGGTLDPSNLITACQSCNSKKGKMGADWFRNPIRRSLEICRLISKL